MSNNGGSGISFLGLLGIVFIVLKLTGTINWSWWLVTLPLWGGLFTILVIVIVIAIGMALGAGFKAAASI